MRIIAGSKRGMKLYSPETIDSRPILDRVKESLFSVLYAYGLPKDAVVADVFSGVGSLGLESLSRGAKFVSFVEKDPRTAAVLKKNLEKARFTNYNIVRSDAFKIGAPLSPQGEKNDLVFIDPPYPLIKDVSESSRLGKLLEKVPDQINPEAPVVIRTQQKVVLLDSYGPLRKTDQRKWGTMNIAFYTLEK